MMRSLFSWLVLIGFLASAAFAVERYFAWQQFQAELENRTRELTETCRLVQAHPDAFGARHSPSDASLKTLAQQAGMRNGIVLNNLGENERDVGEKTKEHNVFSRMSNVPHAGLVAFLAELEAQGDGAKVRELRLTADAARSGIYKEVESTLSIRWSVDAPAALAGGTGNGGAK